MKYGGIIVEKKEYVHLKRMLNISGYEEGTEANRPLERLNNKLKHAHIVDDKSMPVDIVRINSTVTVSSNLGWEKTIQIVTPTDYEPYNSKVSIFTSMGCEIYGHAKSDVVEWKVAGGFETLRIKAVKQAQKEEKVIITI